MHRPSQCSGREGPPVARETGWLVELKGDTPFWSTLFTGDYDDHWTAESTKAIRFARKVDAEAFIAWHGWTEAFPSEHVWDDGNSAVATTPPSDNTDAAYNGPDHFPHIDDAGGGQ